MPRRRRMAKSRVGSLLLDSTHDDAMDLTIGPGKELTAEEEARLRAQWFAHRDEIQLDHPIGSRPWGWWRWESGLGGRADFVVTDKRGYVVMSSAQAEREWLRKHGHLTIFEKRELEKRARLLDEAPIKSLPAGPGDVS